MPRLACPHCKNVIVAEESQRGTVVQCGQCQKRIKVPSAPATQPAGQAGQGRGEGQPTAWLSPGKAAAQAPAPARRAASADVERPARRPTSPDDDDEIVAPEERAAQPAKNRDDDASGPRKKKKKKRRPKTGFIVGILSSLGGLLVIAAIILVLSGKWVDLIKDPLERFLADQGIHPLLAAAGAALVIIIPLGVLWTMLVKSSIVGAMPDDLEFVAADAADFQELDLKRLKSYTEAFEAQGFRPLMDYTVQSDLQGFPRGFARLFVHRQQHCFAEINQGFSDGGAVPMRCNVTSVLDDGWSAATTNRVASKENYLMRRPKAVWLSRPDAKPDGLVAEHLKLRKRMCRDLEIDVGTEDTADAYFDEERQANRERKRAVQRRWALAIVIELWFFEKNPRTEWLGSYAKRAKRSKDEE